MNRFGLDEPTPSDRNAVHGQRVPVSFPSLKIDSAGNRSERYERREGDPCCLGQRDRGIESVLAVDDTSYAT